MVQRYAHLAPDHLAAAVEKIGATSAEVTGELVLGNFEKTSSSAGRK